MSDDTLDCSRESIAPLSAAVHGRKTKVLMAVTALTPPSRLAERRRDLAELCSAKAKASST
jgi:DNA-binding IclR family transcriptional regulator